jgi:hypothetical protein
MENSMGVPQKQTSKQRNTAAFDSGVHCACLETLLLAFLSHVLLVLLLSYTQDTCSLLYKYCCTYSFHIGLVLGSVFAIPDLIYPVV